METQVRVKVDAIRADESTATLQQWPANRRESRRRIQMRHLLYITTAAATVLLLGGQTRAAPSVQGLSGHAQSSVPGCPYLVWRLARSVDGKLSGITYYSDLSGLSLVKGYEDPSTGQFRLEMTSSWGAGPTGMVDGTRSRNGEVVADMKGQGCANMHLVMESLTDINRWTNAGGGGG